MMYLQFKLRMKSIKQVQGYCFELENTAKTGYFSMDPIFENDFKKIVHCFEETYTRQMQDTTFL